ncbi:MAG TPA: hypothetical protein VII56_10400 [Rhizomicrobium sp.]
MANSSFETERVAREKAASARPVRLAWKKPVLRAFSAHEAEVGPTLGVGDGIFTSS